MRNKSKIFPLDLFRLFRANTIFLVICSSIISGCIRDISRNPAVFGIDYTVGATYRLREPLFIRWIPSGLFSRNLYLDEPDSFFGQIPDSIEEYRSNEAAQWPEIIGVVEAGTRVELIKITREYEFELGHVFDIYAVILDGEHEAEKVNLNFISGGMYEPRVPSSLLEIVQ